MIFSRSPARTWRWENSEGATPSPLCSTTTLQRQAVDAQFVKWLMDHQKKAGVFTTVSSLVEQLSDIPAARMQEPEMCQEKTHLLLAAGPVDRQPPGFLRGF